MEVHGFPHGLDGSAAGSAAARCSVRRPSHHQWYDAIPRGQTLGIEDFRAGLDVRGQRRPRPTRSAQTASLFEVKWKSRARIAGTVIEENSLPPARTGTLVASRFLSRLTGLSLNRKLLTG